MPSTYKTVIEIRIKMTWRDALKLRLSGFNNYFNDMKNKHPISGYQPDPDKPLSPTPPGVRTGVMRRTKRRKRRNRLNEMTNNTGPLKWGD